MSEQDETINNATWQMNEAVSMLTEIEVERELNPDLLSEIEAGLPKMRDALQAIAKLAANPPAELGSSE